MNVKRILKKNQTPLKENSHIERKKMFTFLHFLKKGCSGGRRDPWFTRGEPTDLDEIDPELNLPSSHLYLREFGGESLVLAKQRLTAGTVLGTYKGHLHDPHSEDTNSLLKVNRSDGGSPVHVMLEDEGHWLKLMRTANLPTEANICLRITGKDIVCTVTKDVNKEVELKVTCRIVDREEDSLEFDQIDSKSENSPLHSVKEICESDSIKSESSEHDKDLKDCMKSEKMLDFAPGAIVDIREDMSSKHSLKDSERDHDVKKHRTENHDDSGCDVRDTRDEVSSSNVHRPPSSDDKAYEISQARSSSETSPREKNKSTEVDIKPNFSQHGEEQMIFRCPHCSFASVEHYAFNKHLQSHRHYTIKKTSKMTNSKSYCEACKIQFKSIDTYHVHKQLYCKSRNEKEETSSSPTLPEATPGSSFKPGPETMIIRNGINGGVTPSIIQPQAIYAAISTNPLILLPCSLVNGQGLVPQRGVIPTGAPGIVLQTGIACPTIVEKPAVAKVKEESPPSRKTSHPIMNFNADSSDKTLNAPVPLRKRKMSEGDVLNLKKTCSTESIQVAESEEDRKEPDPIAVDYDTPLDLSVKNKITSTSSKPLAKRKNSVISVGSPSPSFQNASDSSSPPRPSILHSRVTMSPSSQYSNDSIHCYPSQVPVVLPRLSHNISERISPLPTILQPDISGDKTVPTSGMPPPPKILKQGNNICEECHIVFYKYDNYLAHKKHYCAFRQRQMSALAAAAASNQEQLSDDNNSNHSGVNESSTSYQSDDASKPSLRRTDHSVEPFRSVITKPSHSVFCCDACGVKFSTSDNLHAHQTYYCIKKPGSAMSKAAALRGDNAESPEGLESPFSGPEEWKCNYCDATCSSYETIRRHLTTHNELRGFRCIVCGYKGNTLRGMRSHACEHLNESTTSIEEFVTNNVIAENGAIPILPLSMDRSDDDSDHSKDSKTTWKKERAYLEKMRERSSLKRDTASIDHSEPNDSSNSPRLIERCPKRTCAK
ncbi:zinc finger protein ush [Caerostris extrusa]|uniref:Zinc finger protein ush n=1 Tax=Caerostris extrusa TaxID=172846 RepID=A0AAV4MCI3_CAEEX|nr:zinc finger protein ush [Caerostris extrusa]